MHNNFKNISYLNYGSLKQKKCYNLLTKLDIFSILSKHNPILVGTIPIGIDIDKSDLDIVCTVSDFVEFKQLLINNFLQYNNFAIQNLEPKCLVCNFFIENIEIEIYASPMESDQSNGYRHMVLEDRLINLFGHKFKEMVINLKRNGLKTEPSFAQLLNLDCNPYDALLLLENYSDEELIKNFKHIIDMDN